MALTELEKILLENIAKRERIRFVRVSRTLLEQGDATGAVVEHMVALDEWEAEIVLREPED